jgi:hypothetical protein
MQRCSSSSTRSLRSTFSCIREVKRCCSLSMAPRRASWTSAGTAAPPGGREEREPQVYNTTRDVHSVPSRATDANNDRTRMIDIINLILSINPQNEMFFTLPNSFTQSTHNQPAVLPLTTQATQSLNGGFKTSTCPNPEYPRSTDWR